MGRPTGPTVVIQRCWETASDKSVTDTANSTRATLGSFGNFLARPLLALATVAQKQDTRSSLPTGLRVTSMNQPLKFSTSLFGQFDMQMLAHVTDYNSIASKS